MKIILLGPPGSGKGTIAEKLAKDFKFLNISAGVLLREEVKKGTTIGKEIKKYIDKGELAPYKFVVEMVKLEIHDKKGYILDGFPRSVEQAKIIEDLNVDLVIYLEISEEKVIERFSGRRIDPNTGKSYHLKFIPPPKAIMGRIITRKDDNPKVVKERFRIYHKETAPVVGYYKKKGILKTVDAAPPPKEVYEAVKKIVKDFQKK